MAHIGSYEIKEKLHSNQKRSVYRVVNKDVKPRILKLLHRVGHDHKDYIKLKKEFEIAKMLDAKYVVKVFQFGTIDGQHFLECADDGGESVKEYLATKSLSFEQKYEIALGMIDALSYVHKMGIVHRDVNPSNFIILPNGTVKIFDFGHADYYVRKNVASSLELDVQGTLNYMAPEQTGKVSIEIGFRTDIYAMGVTLYELFVGKLPFEAQDILELIHMHMARVPVSPKIIKDTLPLGLSRIIMKMIEKTPEKRYQSLYGVKDDFLQLKKQLKFGQEDLAVLAKHDVSSFFHLSPQPYGRDLLWEDVKKALDRVVIGAKEWLIFNGKHGLGKSYALSFISDRLVNQGAFVLEGKFSVSESMTPYEGIVLAISQGLNTVLSHAEDEIAAFRNNLIHEAGPHLDVLLQMIPELETITGPVAKSTSLNPVESENRFNMALTVLLKLLKSTSPYMVLALDHVKVDDVATHQLLEYLMESQLLDHFLIITTYQDEVTIDQIKGVLSHVELDLSCQILQFEPLSIQHVGQLVMDSFGMDLSTSMALSEVIYQKTLGNPASVKAMLYALYQSGHLYFDDTKGQWTYHLQAALKMKISSNVIDEMMHQVQELEDEYIQLLQVLSVFHGTVLASDVFNQLDMDLSDFFKSMLYCIDQHFIYATGALTDLLITESFDHQVYLTFDQEALKKGIYKTIPSPICHELHLKIGMYRYHAYVVSRMESDLQGCLYHLNRVIPLVDDQDILLLMAKQNHLLAKRHQKAIAYQLALQALENAVTAIEKLNTLEETLYFDVRLDRAEMLYLMGHFQKAEDQFERLLVSAKTDVQYARVNRIKLMLYVNRGETHSVLSIATETLERLGVKLYRKAQIPYLLTSMTAIRMSTYYRQPHKLLSIPLAKEERITLALEILNILVSVSYLLNKLLFVQIVLTMMRLSLKHGTMRLSPFAYGTYGIIETGLFKNHDKALVFGETSIRLAEKVNDFEAMSKTHFTMGFFLSHWMNPISESIPYLEKGKNFSYYGGDMVYYAYNLAGKFIAQMASSVPLEVLSEEIQSVIEDVRVLKVEDVSNLLIAINQYILNMKGQTNHLLSFGTSSFNELNFEQTLKNSNMPSIWAHYLVFKIKACAVYGLYSEAIQLSVEVEPLLSELMGLYITTEYQYYLTLSHLMLLNAQQVMPQSQLKVTHRYIRQFKKYQKKNPQNFEHKYFHLLATYAFTKNDLTKAHVYFEKALKSAQTYGFKLEEALIHESLASYYLRDRHHKMHEVHLQQAFHAFHSIGYTRKMNLMQNAHQEVTFARAEIYNSEIDIALESSSVSGVSQLDIFSIMKSSQQLAAEFDKTKLIDITLGLLMEVAGADRCVCMLQDKVLVIIAQKGLDLETYLEEPVPVRYSGLVPEKVINYVHRTQEVVILDRAVANRQFGTDEYIQTKQTKSLICMPFVHKNEYFGMLYLENNLMVNAFAEDRVETLRVILSQFTIAFENASLYSALEASQEDLLRHQENLEGLVRERTYELSKTKVDIENLLDNVNQGFLSINSSGNINQAYSKVCLDLFKHDIAGKPFYQLIEEHIPLKDAALIRDVIEKIFQMQLAVKREVYISLLPERIVVEDRVISCVYHFVNNRFLQQVIVVLTDITEKIQLEKEMADERSNLRMIVNVMRYQNNFRNSVKRLTAFVEEGYKDVLARYEKLEAVRELLRIVHTFKGDFAQWSLQGIAQELHEIENDLVLASQQVQNVTHENMEAYFEAIDVHAILDSDLTTIKQAIGHDYFERDTVIQVDLPYMNQVKDDLIHYFGQDHASEIERQFHRIQYLPLKDVIQQYSDYIVNLAATYQKNVAPIHYEGDPIRIDYERYDPFLKSLIHIFRNIVQYGIEEAFIRKMLNKPTEGQVVCRVTALDQKIQMVISDDGGGLDMDRISERASQMCKTIDRNDWVALQQCIFEHGFSTREETDELSGRGVGLNAVRQAVEAFGGSISVSSQKDQGTIFTIIIPNLNS